MAKPAKSSKSETKVTRISASDDRKKSTKPARANAKTAVKPAHASSAKSQTTEPKTTRRRRNPFGPIVRYVKGAWAELRQVRWPDRRATWGMTGALLLFTLFFLIVIVALDYGFSELFKVLMGN